MASRAHQNLPIVSKGCLTFGKLFQEYQKVGDQKSSNLLYSVCFLVFEQFKAPYSIARGHEQQLFLFNSASQLMFSFGVFFTNLLIKIKSTMN